MAAADRRRLSLHDRAADRVLLVAALLRPRPAVRRGQRLISHSSFIRLAAPTADVVVDGATGTPAVVHFGAPLGDDVALLADLFDMPRPSGGLDTWAPLSVVPEHGSGFLGRPGLSGKRADGSAWAPRFHPDAPPVVDSARGALSSTSSDDVAGLRTRVTMTLHPSGVLGLGATLVNAGDDDYQLDALGLTLPLPRHANEIVTLVGRHTREFQPLRSAWPSGTHVVENRSGRTSHDRLPVVFVGEAGFTEERGEMWALHVAWSGNSFVHLEAGSDGRRFIQAGELLLPGEIVLAPGEVYATPTIYAAHSTHGFNGISDAFHTYLRARPHHPRRPRPVTLNTWEAVYFRHDRPTLTRLAERAAAVGIERFVLDDGWFHGRRDDRAGLGDWWVDASAWPDGLDPLIDVVDRLGMEFGLWVEPEMVNPDSDLYRAHPEWVLTDARYEPVLGRNQLVLDIARDDVSEYLFARLHALLDAHRIAAVKWDMNRPLVHATHDGRAAVHRQTVALYGLLDRLRSAHPLVEFETCASGGGRADFEILRRTERVWTSDSNDARERQHIQRGFSYLFPPEVMGAHIGPPRAHTTGRRHDLAFRGVTALFGHLGVEWNLLECDDDELVGLGDIIAVHRHFRSLLHTGRVVRFDHPNDAVLAHGVYGADRRHALVAVVQLDTARDTTVEPLRIGDLDPATHYDVKLVDLPGQKLAHARHQPRWLEHGLTATGRQLAAVGLPLPILLPETAVLVELVALS